MATKAIDVIIAALFEIGEYAPGEDITDADAESCLHILNDILDGWSNEPQACFAELTQTFTLVTNQTQYTIGPSGSADINGTRPLKIIQAFLTDPESNRYPIGIVTQFDWNRLMNLEINGQIPTTLFYDAQDPIATINLWPSPVLPWTVSVVSYLQLTAFPGLFTDVVLPRGYVPALKYNLAVEICPTFGKVPQPVTIDKANKYLAALKRTNYRDQPAKIDEAIVFGPRTSAYSIRNDSGAGGGPYG